VHILVVRSKEIENMKLTTIVAGLCISIAPATSQRALAQAAQNYAIVDGEVIRYEAGQTIVIRGTDNKDVAYTLSPGMAVPAEVKVGRRALLYTEPGLDGKTQIVTRVTTTSVTPEGQVKRVIEETRNLPSGAVKRTTSTDTSGTVAAYEVGKTLTVTRSDGSTATYVLNAQTKVPAGLVIGKSVSVVPLAPAGAGDPVARTITYVTTTTTSTETVPAN
jgi:hypothetical protein